MDFLSHLGSVEWTIIICTVFICSGVMIGPNWGKMVGDQEGEDFIISLALYPLIVTLYSLPIIIILGVVNWFF